jgi:Flp pilus assembly protein TadB
MSLVWAGAFLALARLVPALTPHPLVSGIIFGVFVFFAMRLVVLPLSAYPYPVTFKPLATALDLLSHTLLFGVPIAWAIQRALLDVPAKASQVAPSK